MQLMQDVNVLALTTRSPMAETPRIAGYRGGSERTMTSRELVRHSVASSNNSADLSQKARWPGRAGSRSRSFEGGKRNIEGSVANEGAPDAGSAFPRPRKGVVVRRSPY